MFQSTTHYKHWIFADEEDLSVRRIKANESFISECENKLQTSDNIRYLKVDEEAKLVYYYLGRLIDFCCKFKPPLPKNVISTSVHYFKRFYLNNSTMEHHPKHIMVTCVYLATKIEEFNINMDQLVSNIRGDQSKAAAIVLNNEQLLLNRLNYELTIHHPYRPVEGFLIDIKTRYPDIGTNPEQFRKFLDQFLDKIFYTDATFLFSPNQLALLAIVYTAEKFDENLDPYLRILFNNRPDEIIFLKRALQKLLEMINSIQESQLREIAKSIEAKLDQCQQLTAKLHPEQQQSIDDDDDEMVSFERYSQFRDESEMMDREFIQRSSQ